MTEDPDTLLDQWWDISTAPKAGWFLALRSPKYTGPTSCRVAVIHRIEGVSFGPWEGSEEAYYKADFFSHWTPLTELPCPTRAPAVSPLSAQPKVSKTDPNHGS